MPHLPPSAVLWLERADIDYIGPFAKAWAAFNAWYRHASQSRRDVDGLRYVKQSVNPVRGQIKPLLCPLMRDGNGKAIPDSADALQFKGLIRNLHVCLENYHIEILRDESVERISFRTVRLSQGIGLPKTAVYRQHEYIVQRQNQLWVSTVRRRNNGPVAERIEQANFDPVGFQSDAAYNRLSLEQRGRLLALYNECNPRPLTDLLAGNAEPIIADDVEFKCTDEQLFCGLIEIIYALRNAMLHGELQPHEQAFKAYEYAYRIVMRFLGCLKD